MAQRPRSKQAGHFNPDVAAYVRASLSGRGHVTSRPMFGYPAFFAGGRMFACVYADGLGIKLPEDRVRQLLERPGVAPFRPHGKPRMRRWIFIRPGGTDGDATANDLLLEALRFARAAT